MVGLTADLAIRCEPTLLDRVDAIGRTAPGGTRSEAARLALETGLDVLEASGAVDAPGDSLPVLEARRRVRESHAATARASALVRTVVAGTEPVRLIAGQTLTVLTEMGGIALGAEPSVDLTPEQAASVLGSDDVAWRLREGIVALLLPGDDVDATRARVRRAFRRFTTKTAARRQADQPEAAAPTGCDDGRRAALVALEAVSTTTGGDGS